VHGGQVAEVRERRRVARGVEDAARELQGERAPADEVAGGGEGEGRGEHAAPRARRRAARLGGDHVQPRPRVGEDLVDPGPAEQRVEAGA
jgi:hypothetical protein